MPDDHQNGSKLQALSAQGQLSRDVQQADINVLRANLDTNLQRLHLSDAQVRLFTQMGEDEHQASLNAQVQAEQRGVNAAAVQSAVDKGWQQFAYSQLTNEQQRQLRDPASIHLQPLPREGEGETAAVAETLGTGLGPSRTALDLGPLGAYSSSDLAHAGNVVLWMVGITIVFWITVPRAWRFFLRRLAEVSDAVRGKR